MKKLVNLPKGTQVYQHLDLACEDTKALKELVKKMSCRLRDSLFLPGGWDIVPEIGDDVVGRVTYNGDYYDVQIYSWWLE